MNIGILSPHTDDAIWSTGEHIIASPHAITVITPFAAIPADPAGHLKHTLLRAEHTAACQLLNIAEVNGPFLDDVYPSAPYMEFSTWLTDAMADYDQLWLPLGIHHPDHIKVHHIAAGIWNSRWPRPELLVYEELPYRTRYQEKASYRYEDLFTRFSTVEAYPHPPDAKGLKMEAVLAYKSQVDDDVVKDVMVPEQMWRVS